MVIIAIMYNESGGALIRTQSAEPERALNEVTERRITWNLIKDVNT